VPLPGAGPRAALVPRPHVSYQGSRTTLLAASLSVSTTRRRCSIDQRLRLCSALCSCLVSVADCYCLVVLAARNPTSDLHHESTMIGLPLHSCYADRRFFLGTSVCTSCICNAPKIQQQRTVSSRRYGLSPIEL
jgi:hypothetical protein